MILWIRVETYYHQWGKTRAKNWSLAFWSKRMLLKSGHRPGILEFILFSNLSHYFRALQCAYIATPGVIWAIQGRDSYKSARENKVYRTGNIRPVTTHTCLLEQNQSGPHTEELEDRSGPHPIANRNFKWETDSRSPGVQTEVVRWILRCSFCLGGTRTRSTRCTSLTVRNSSLHKLVYWEYRPVVEAVLYGLSQISAP